MVDTAAPSSPAKIEPPVWPDPINLAYIARMAGVARVAVVNWRRRSPDFPEPNGGTEESPTFPLAAARAWLVEHDKLAPCA
ncbi:hypothetical protein GCM10027589_04290 [Actinocorallia lasiicapitis]